MGEKWTVRHAAKSAPRAGGNPNWQRASLGGEEGTLRGYCKQGEKKKQKGQKKKKGCPFTLCKWPDMVRKKKGWNI